MEIKDGAIVGQTEVDGLVLGRAAALGDQAIDNIEEMEVDETVREFQGDEAEAVVIALARWAAGPDYVAQQRGGRARFVLRESLTIDSGTAAEYLCKIALGGLDTITSQEATLYRHYRPVSIRG
jgi:hypothetical protein